MKTQLIITTTPDPSLFTEPVEILISNLPPNVNVILQALLKDEDNHP